MLELIYITHLYPGKQKNLAYALGLAKAFSAPLSLFSSARLDDPSRGKISIWSPDLNAKRSGWSDVSNFSRIRKEHFSLYLLGKPNQPAKSNNQSYRIIQRLVDLGFPILWLPFDYPFRGIKSVLFAGNGPGLTEHKVKQLIAANFLPRVFQVINSTLSRIHWNNISHIDKETQRGLDFSCPILNAELIKNEIDLTVYPIDVTVSPFTTIDWRAVSSVQHPLLFLPLGTQDTITSHEKAYLTA